VWSTGLTIGGRNNSCLEPYHRLAAIAGGISVAFARTFKIIYPSLTHIAMEESDRVFRIFDSVGRPTRHCRAGLSHGATSWLAYCIETTTSVEIWLEPEFPRMEIV
jgi:hypothetical protein